MTDIDTHCSWNTAFNREIDQVQRGHRGSAPVTENLVGLAISGGGIRSATFSLGVLEALKGYGLLSRIHYLSTVSGGGYIGAWLSAACKRHQGWLDPAADWTASIAHLRRYSNYLSPTVGFFSADTWSMVTIWIRNTMLIQLTVILAIGCALLLPRPLFEGFQHWPQVGDWRWTTIILFLIGVVGIAGNQMRLTSHGGVTLLQARSWAIGLAGGTISLGAAWLYGRQVNFDPFHGGEVNYLEAGPIALLLVVGVFMLQPFAVKLVGLWPSADPPQQINYTQGWVQGVIVVPMMVAGYLVAAILWGESQGVPGVNVGLARLDDFAAFFTTAWRYWPFPLSVVFVSYWLLSFCSVRSRRDWKGLLAACAVPFAAIAVLHALLCAIMVLLHGWAANPAEGAWRAFVWGPPLVVYTFTITIVVLIGMMGRESTEGVREWWSRLGAWLGIYGVAWMVIAVSAVYGPRWVDMLLESHPWTSLSAGGGWLATVVAGLVSGKSGATGSATKRGAGHKILEAVAAVAPFIFIAGLLIGTATALENVIASNSLLDWRSVGFGSHAQHAPFLNVSLIVLGGCLAVLLLTAARVDINEFSLNAFYRNRLVRCYLGATRYAQGERNPQNFTGFDDEDDIPLADLTETSGAAAGPFHIINCALNLGGSTDLSLHTRHSAAFTLSPLLCGSGYKSRDQAGTASELGYVPTRVYGGEFGAPTLGQAIAVSGAAASPNMGYHTSPVVAFLLTVFNVRLGWWFPNPGRSGITFPSPHFSLRYLFAELFGGANDKSKFVMISDGGHFENLAAYELVKRRCRVIIISDGECDSDLTFAGLGTLIRMCEVDFGVTITMDVGDIRREADAAWSRERWAVGRIEYGHGHPDGVLIYLKASMTGHEDTSVLQYKASHQDFPHETTGDQFYGEDQFESYRRLGRDIAATAFHSVRGEPDMVALATRLLHRRAVGTGSDEIASFA